MRFAHVAAMLMLVVVGQVCATDFYVDPVHGNDTNDGSKNEPWRTLQHVFDDGLVESREWESLPYEKGKQFVKKNSGAPVRAGDTIWLLSGDYGDLVIQDFYNQDFITLAAYKEHDPRFRSVRLRSGSHWILKGLHVSGDYRSGQKPKAMIVVESHGFRGPVRDVRVERCVLKSAEDTSGWSAEDWNQRSCDGISAGGSRITLRANCLKNVNFGIDVTASDSLIERNTVKNFAGDGLRGLGNHCVFQYNRVQNCYDVNANHDDGFQSWGRGPDGKVGKGEVKGVVLRGNIIINYEDPEQPHRGSLQGIGCFDGIYTDWVIENNVVIVDHWHGITLVGAIGCRIANNTVIDPNKKRPGPPWVRIGDTKGTASRNCVVINNLTSSLQIARNSTRVKDHNMIIEDPESLFVNPAKQDLRLKRGSPAIDAGRRELAPEKDRVGIPRPQGEAVDLGAYESPEMVLHTSPTLEENESGELSELLTALLISAPIGLVIGVVLRRAKPEWCKSYAKFCLDRKWWLFAPGALFFLVLSITNFVQGRHYFGTFFLLFAFLEAYGFVKYGFHSLTPEEEAQIDAAEPANLWPPGFWKRREGREGDDEGKANKQQD